MNQSLTTQWKRDCWRGKKYRKTRKKNTLRAKERTKNKANPHMASTPGLEAWATFVGGECSNHCSHHGDTLAPWIDVCTHEEIIKPKRCWVHLFNFSLYDGVHPLVLISTKELFFAAWPALPCWVGSCLVFLENCRCVYMRRPAGPLAEIFLQATTISANGAAGLLI